MNGLSAVSGCQALKMDLLMSWFWCALKTRTRQMESTFEMFVHLMVSLGAKDFILGKILPTGCHCQSRQRMTKCPVCKQPAELRINLKLFCSYECAAKWGRAQAEKVRAKKQKEFNAETRRRKLAIKKRSEWLSDLQDVVNKFVRLRDVGKPCPSCGRSEHEVEQDAIGKTGGAWDAGHYLSRGSHPELRFCLDNIARQCKSCNGGSGNYARKNHEVQKHFRIELINRIGLEKVEWLEGPHEPLKLTIEQIQQLIAEYKIKTKEMA